MSSFSLRMIAVALSSLGAAACASGSSGVNAEPTGHTRAALGTTAQQIVGAYQLSNVVSGDTIWRQLNLVADGTFNGFAACKVPACSAFRASGSWDVDDASQTLTLSPTNGAASSYSITIDWDGAGGLEVANDSGDVQLAYYAATCTAIADCDGQTVAQGVQTTCPDGYSIQTACQASVCQAACAATVHVAQRGEHCGGFIMNAAKCADGLVCRLGFIPDGGGTCEPPETPASCATDGDCLSGQVCFSAVGQCGGNGHCQTPPTSCPTDCTDQSAVCGCDANTYCNACVAASSGVSLASGGACN